MAYLSFDPADPGSVRTAVQMFGQEIVDKATVWVETRDGDKITIGDEPVAQTVTDTYTVTHDQTVVADVELAACPTCGGSKGSPKGDCSSDYHKSIEPDVEDAKVRIIEVDTDDQSSDGGSEQAAPSSEPGDSEATLSAPEPINLDEVTEDQLVLMSFANLRQAASLAISELAETRAALVEEKTARTSAEHERDEVTEAAATLMQRAAQIIERVGNIPTTRKAVLREVQKDYSSIEAYYGEEFTKFLRDPAPRGR